MTMEVGSAVAVAVPLTGDDVTVAAGVEPGAIAERDGDADGLALDTERDTDGDSDTVPLLEVADALNAEDNDAAGVADAVEALDALTVLAAVRDALAPVDSDAVAVDDAVATSDALTVGTAVPDALAPVDSDAVGVVDADDAPDALTVAAAEPDALAPSDSVVIGPALLLMSALIVTFPSVVVAVGFCARSVTLAPLLSHVSTWDARILVWPADVVVVPRTSIDAAVILMLPARPMVAVLARADAVMVWSRL
jgi:hypothetical protein